MPYDDWLMLMGMGGLFILLGLAGIIWGKNEERGYYGSLTTKHDVREFLEHSPGRPEPGALRIGGWIFITLGLVMLAGGGAFWLWG